MKGAWVRRFGHTTVVEDGDQPLSMYWYWLTDNDNLSAQEGYEISVPGDHSGKFTFTGKLNTTDQEITIRYDENDYENHRGYWVVANPFTAGLDLETDIDFKDDFNQQVHIFHAGSSKQFQGQAQREDMEGQYETYAKNTRSDIVSSMQGFVVSFKPDRSKTEETLVLRYPGKATNNILRSATQNSKVFTEIRLLSEENTKDRMYIYLNEGTTRGYDNGWDGEKLFSSASLAQLYSEEEGGQYQIDAIPELDGTYLKMKAEAGVREYTLRFTHTNLAGLYETITLTDLVTGQETDITNGVDYRFTADNEESAEQRFVIRTQDFTGIIGQPEVTTVDVYEKEGHWYISNRSGEAVSFTLYTVSGQAVSQDTLPAGEEMQIDRSDYASGVYLIRFGSKTMQGTSEKIIF